MGDAVTQLPDDGTDQVPDEYTLEGDVRQFLDSEEATPEFLRECLWRIVDILRDLAMSQRRAVVGILSLMLVFELLNRSLVNEASLVGVKLARLDFLQTPIPAAACYLFLRSTAVAKDRDIYTSVYYAIVGQRFPGLYASQIDRLFTTSRGLTFSSVPKRYYMRGDHIWPFALPVAEGRVTVLITPAFSFYAYWQIFARSGIGSLATWLSLIVAVALLLVAFKLAYAFLNTSDMADQRLLHDMFRPR
ncbi:hypothetical protein [Micromonospora sp. NPDC005291]|uniref:hypothetical protein n=1 Tax=Micromonospora sp. NPDC005291 TaxID=3156872 RepID=UPI0033B1DCA8